MLTVSVNIFDDSSRVCKECTEKANRQLSSCSLYAPGLLCLAHMMGSL